MKGICLRNMIFLLIPHSLFWVMCQSSGDVLVFSLEALWETCEVGYGFAQGCGVEVYLYDQVREFSEKLLQNIVVWKIMSPGVGGKYTKLQQMRINRILNGFLLPDKERDSSHCADSNPF